MTAATAMARRRTGILVFDDVEVLDFCGPFEVFLVVRPDETAPYMEYAWSQSDERRIAMAGNSGDG